MKRVYYARAVDGRDRATLKSIADELCSVLAQRGLELLDPVDYADSALAAPYGDIVENDLALLKTADAVLMDLSLERWTYVGCICELVYAHLWRIPVVVFITGSTLSERAWLRYHATRITSDRETALTALDEILSASSQARASGAPRDGAA